MTGQEKNVSPWPRYDVRCGGGGYEISLSDGRIRFCSHRCSPRPIHASFCWSHRKSSSPASIAASTWKVISPDLTRNDPCTEGPSGGPIDYDNTGAELFPDIASLAVSPLDANVLWAGSADGLVHVTKDHGAHWAAVTPPDLPQWAQISSIEPSHVARGTAYLTASRYQWDDYPPVRVS